MPDPLDPAAVRADMRRAMELCGLTRRGLAAVLEMPLGDVEDLLSGEVDPGEWGAVNVRARLWMRCPELIPDHFKERRKE